MPRQPRRRHRRARAQDRSTIGLMFARRQLSRPQYLAAKAYAESPGKLDAIIVQATGLDGVQLVATVIGGTPLKETASAFGDSSTAAASVGWLLRRSLNALAARLGYSR